MQKLNILIAILLTMFLALAPIKTTVSQTPHELYPFFSKKYAGISIQTNATKETIPNANMTVAMLINCTADGVYIHFLNLTIYGYRHFRYGLEKISLYSTSIINGTFLIYHNITEKNYTITIPDDVWDLTYAELLLKYSIEGSPYPYEEYKEEFPITNVRNVLWEELEQKLSLLNNTLAQLNETFWESFHLNLTVENLAYINRTLLELQHNYTVLQGSLNELDTTRRAAAILTVTTIFFVATTLYMIIRKPKEYY
jgi:hypothetical protein